MLKPFAFLKHHGYCERSYATCSVNHDTPSKVHDAQSAQPAIAVGCTAPDPVSDGIVDEQGPGDHDNDEGLKREFFGPCTRQNNGHHESKHHLKSSE